MEIRIGVTYSPKEIEIDLADDDAAGDALVEQISASVGEEGSMLWLTDRKGRRVGIPVAKLSYVEIGAPRSDRGGSGSARTVTHDHAVIAVAGGPVTDLLDRRLLFVTGKGGVGKSTTAAALALLSAVRGKRTLACEVDAKGDLADFFETSRPAFEPHKVTSNLWLMAMDTEASLREYLHLQLRLPTVSRLGPLAKVFDFVSTAAPGVREILTVGKIGWEVRERHYDLVVVDAPATGHIVGQLTAPQAINDLVRVGQVREQTGWLADLLADPATTGLVVVTTPEEMPVNETIELVQQGAVGDPDRRGRHRREPGAARAVQRRRRSGLRAPERAGVVGPAGRRRPRPGRARPRGRPPGRHPPPDPGRPPRAPALVARPLRAHALRPLPVRPRPRPAQHRPGRRRPERRARVLIMAPGTRVLRTTPLAAGGGLSPAAPRRMAPRELAAVSRVRG